MKHEGRALETTLTEEYQIGTVHSSSYKNKRMRIGIANNPLRRHKRLENWKHAWDGDDFHLWRVSLVLKSIKVFRYPCTFLTELWRTPVA
jgi:hypothetical protein